MTSIGGHWSVSDGRASQRFEDGICMRGKGPATAGRLAATRALFGLANAAAPAAAPAVAPTGMIEEDAATRRLRAQGRA